MLDVAFAIHHLRLGSGTDQCPYGIEDVHEDEGKDR